MQKIYGAKGDIAMSDLRTGFFTYPWDLLEPGPEQIIAQMSDDLHCNAIMVNAQYHHAGCFGRAQRGQRPFTTKMMLWRLFQPNAALYADCGFMPVQDEELAASNVLAAAKQAADSHQMDFGIWVVGLHNSSLGEQNPDVCVVNCFGDVYTYALCPSQKRNQQYVRALVQDVCDQFAPDRIMLEAVGVLGLRHWVHHELFMTEWDETLELLTSICFCPACAEKGKQVGIDVDGLRDEIRSLADILLNEERGTLPLTFSLGEVPSLLHEIDGLYTYLKVCSQSVIEVVQAAQAVTKQAGIELEVIPSSFHRPSSRAYLERVSLKELQKVCDYLAVSAYFATPAEVEADLRWTSYLVQDAKMTAGINACAPTSVGLFCPGRLLPVWMQAVKVCIFIIMVCSRISVWHGWRRLIKQYCTRNNRLWLCKIVFKEKLH